MTVIDTKLDVLIVLDDQGRYLGHIWPEPNGDGGEFWLAEDIRGKGSRWEESWQENPFSQEEAVNWLASRSPFQPVTEQVLRVAAQQPDRVNYHAARQLVPDTRVQKIGARKCSK